MTVIRDLLAPARCVLLDFDGPVARLFFGRSAGDIATRLVERILRDIPAEELASDLLSTRDPLRVLKIFAKGRPGHPLTRELHAILSGEEVRAALTAKPTLGASPLIRALVALDRRLAVTTNNSAEAASLYLARRNLLPYFGAAHVHGRTEDVGLLKPHPDSLSRALDGLGLPPSDALMIGDGASDVAAAEAAGVAFLGYARNERKYNELRGAGAPEAMIVRSLEPVRRGAVELIRG
ncbi:HAD family hydrolase [Streptomyces sp. NPDC058653]|uniref:HAD family hydrolase n=1 Tax=Streptomyces sp. NPDC058653 TaxID=3346576 RepID=UPI00364B842C